MHKRPYTDADRKQDAKKMRALVRQLNDVNRLFVSCWENQQYADAENLIATIEKSAEAVRVQAESMADWQAHGVLVSYAK